jgi:TonB-linked SusC/RagA family outer membrane protein
MNQFRRLCAMLMLALAPTVLEAQQRGSITGQVVDAATGNALSGAQITVQGVSLRTVTNAQGRFTLNNVPAGRYTVSASQLGRATVTLPATVAAGTTADLTFRLGSSAVAIQGLVVTATGREQRTRELGNAVGQINVAEQVELAAVPTAASLIQGRSAGVTVTQSSGTTGTGARVRIRGANSVSLSNEPLLVIDGIRLSNDAAAQTIAVGGQSPSQLNDLNPEEIESIEILKGPAASALYGTAAANGVIQVTTRRGRAGATRWGFYAESGTLRDVTEYPDNVTSLNGCLLLLQADGECTVREDSLVRFNPLENSSTSPFRDGGRRQVGLNVSGGSEAATYFVSGEFERENGVYRNNDLRRASFRANLTGRVRENLNLRVNSGFIGSMQNAPQNDNNLLSPLLNGLLGQGDTTQYENAAFYFTRPEFLEQIEVDQGIRRANVSVNADYRPTSWLQLNGTTGVDYSSRADRQLVQPGVGNLADLGAIYAAGFRTNNRVAISNYTGNLNSTATFDLRNNIVSTSSVGVQYQRDEYTDTRAQGQGLARGTGSLAGTTRLFSVGENNTTNVTAGFYAQQQFAINDRLFVTGAIRADDNSAFGVESGLAYYPSLSASWVVSDEPFFPEVGFLSRLRLRGAYGKAGLRPTFRDAITFFNVTSTRVGSSDQPALAVGGTGDPRLRPEVSRELELGFDLGLFDDRVGLQFTSYNKRSEDALISRRLAGSLGLFTTRFENIGEVSNRGLEAELTMRVLERRNFGLDLTATASTNRNRLEKSDVPRFFAGFADGPQVFQQGLPLGTYFNRPFEYADKNGDNLISVDEVTVADSSVDLGSPYAKREASFSPNITLFQNIKISGLLNYQGGHKLLNFTRYDRCFEAVCSEIYTGDLQQQAAYIAYFEQPAALRTTAGYIEDADFVKLREVAVTLGLPRNLAQRFGSRGASITFAGRNLKTWTDYTGFDPEVNSFGQANFSTADYYSQPPVRSFTARVDLNF